MKHKIIGHRGEITFIVVEVDGVTCAARYSERLHCYVDMVPYGNSIDAKERCKRGMKGKWFDYINSNMEIPTNPNKRDYRAEVTQRIINDLEKQCEVTYFWSEKSAPIEIFIDVASDFVKKGYYAKVNYFVESWKGVQCVIISKNPLYESHSRMVYSQMIH